MQDSCNVTFEITSKPTTLSYTWSILYMHNFTKPLGSCGSFGSLTYTALPYVNILNNTKPNTHL